MNRLKKERKKERERVRGQDEQVCTRRNRLKGAIRRTIRRDPRRTIERSSRQGDSPSLSFASLIRLSCISALVLVIVYGCLTLACPPRSKEKRSFAFLSLLLVFLAQLKYYLLLPSRSLFLVRVSILACLYLSIFSLLEEQLILWGELLSISLALLLVLLASRKIYLFLLRVCIHSSLSLSILFVTAGRVARCLSRSLACSNLSEETLSLACVFNVSVSLCFFCHCLESSFLSLSLPCFFYSTIPCALLYLLILQSTIRSTLYVNITTNYPLWSLCPTDYPPLSGDTTTNYSLYSACRCYDRLSTLLSLALFQSTMLCSLLCLLILKPTIRSAMPANMTTDYPLSSVQRYLTIRSTCLAIRY
jgi:hypothetical protein